MYTNISINKDCWIRFGEGYISIGSDTYLPKDIHYTISFNPNKPDLNFHITKNVSDYENKPQIKICVIDKKFLFDEELILGMMLPIIFKELVPVDIEALKKTNNDLIGFIPLKIYSEGETSEFFERKFSEELNKISTVKRNRIKIKGDLEKSAKNFIKSDDIINSINENIIELPSNPDAMPFGGTIVTGERQIHALFINGNWYEYKELRNMNFLDSIIDPSLVKSIRRKFMESLVHLKKAKTYQYTEHLNNPIRLEIRKKDKKNI